MATWLIICSGQFEAYCMFLSKSCDFSEVPDVQMRSLSNGTVLLRDYLIKGLRGPENIAFFADLFGYQDLMRICRQPSVARLRPVTFGAADPRS